MATRPIAMRDARMPLTRERVIEAAIVIADESGIDSLSMRRLGQALGVEAMSLYNHVANKDDIFRGIVDIVLGEVELPAPGAAWKATLRRTAISIHDALVRHPWAAGLMLSASGDTEARMRYMNAILGCLREGGFSAGMTDHAYHALESHIFGFTLWIVGMELDDATLPGLATAFLERISTGEYPHLVEHVQQHLKERDPKDEGEFAFGLDLILDGLERKREAA